jgi:hypothetical protein
MRGNQHRRHPSLAGNLGRDIDDLKSAIAIAVSQPLVKASRVDCHKPVAAWVSGNEDVGVSATVSKVQASLSGPPIEILWSCFARLEVNEADDGHSWPGDIPRSYVQDGAQAFRQPMAGLARRFKCQNGCFKKKIVGLHGRPLGLRLHRHRHCYDHHVG